MFAAVILEHGERSKRAKLTGATGVVVDAAAKHGWLRVRVGDAALNWHQRHLRRVAADVNPFERLTPDLLLLVLDRVGCHRALAAAARRCRDWRVACRQPSLWHTVDVVVVKNGRALAYALHLIDVRARLRSLRVSYSRFRHEDANVVAWLLRECDTSGLERARVTASSWVTFADYSPFSHLKALRAMPSLSAERRARVSKLIDDFYAVVANAHPEPVLDVLAAQAPKLRALDIGSVCPGAADTETGLSAVRELEDLRALVATHAFRHSTLGVGRGLHEVILTLPKLRRLELGGFDPHSILRSTSARARSRCSTRAP